MKQYKHETYIMHRASGSHLLKADQSSFSGGENRLLLVRVLVVLI